MNSPAWFLLVVRPAIRPYQRFQRRVHTLITFLYMNLLMIVEYNHPIIVSEIQGTMLKMNTNILYIPISK